MESIEVYFEKIGSVVEGLRKSVGCIEKITKQRSDEGFKGLNKIWESNKASEIFQRVLRCNENMTEEIRMVGKYAGDIENAANSLKEVEGRNRMLIT